MTDWILNLVAQGGYAGIAFLMALENIFPPIPSEVIMGLGGLSVARGTFSLTPLLIAGTAGSVAGNYVWYWAGQRIGTTRLKPFIDRWGRWLTMSWGDVERVVAVFERWGGPIVFVARFSPFFRTIISLPAGMAHMNAARFLIYTAAGSLIWNAVLVWAGYSMGTHFADLERYTGPAAIVVGAVIAILYLYRVVTWTPHD